ncbi:MAG: protein kinase, partial [Sandaracinaceae bacterium]
MRDPHGRSLEVVHRDVSPHNLFLTYDGAVKVVDFGIARAVGRLHETSAEVLKGKLSYLSPEYVAQRPVDRRLDVWALGVVLWELLAGQRLFQRPNQYATIRAITEAPIPSLSAIEPAYEGELERIVTRALAR